MSASPQTATTQSIRITDLHRMKTEGRRIVMTTCYETLFARLLDECGVDLSLVGDSVAEVLNGASSTLAIPLLPGVGVVSDCKRWAGFARDRLRACET